MSKNNLNFFQSLERLQEYIVQNSLHLRSRSDLTPLWRPFYHQNWKISNRIVFQPMEGCDATLDGFPSPLTFRRYRRFGQSGAGILWFEATAIVPEGRANPHQLLLNEETKSHFIQLIAEVNNAYTTISSHFPHLSPPLKILQLTHSGRYSNPGKKEPYRLYSQPLLDRYIGVSPNSGRIVSDEYLEGLIGSYREIALLAKEVGFDGVDVKACHRYLLNESLSAFTRIDSRYGGENYEDRTRLFKSIIQDVARHTLSPNFFITTRMNIYDAFPYPFGWGVLQKQSVDLSEEELYSVPPIPDLTEPSRLISELREMGIWLVNTSMGNPYFNSYITRPFSIPAPNAPSSPEHPIYGVDRLITLISQLKHQIPSDMNLISSGYSWLRHFSPYFAASELESNHVDFIGWGRMSIAYPDFPKELISKGKIVPEKCCIACSKCTELMRLQSVTGCVARDPDPYLTIYHKAKEH